MAMAFLQDKKLIMHISLEIITLGSLSYFFYNRTKNLENRLESRIDQLVHVTSVLQQEILELKKHIASSSFELDEEYKLFKMFKERDLKNKFMNEQTIKTQSKQQVRQVNSVQQMSIPMSTPMSTPTRVPPTQDEYIAIFSNSVPSFKHAIKSPPAIVEVMEDEDNENHNENHNENDNDSDNDKKEKNKKQTDAELDEELGPELKELNELNQ